MKKFVLTLALFLLSYAVFSQGKAVAREDILQNLPVMNPVPGGSFTLGTDSFLDSVEERAAPAHRVELSSFIMAKTLVTQRLWDLFIQDTEYHGYSSYHGYHGSIKQNIQGPDSPTIFMTWSEAIVFCNWLSNRLGLTPAYLITGTLDPGLRGGIEVQWIRGTNGYRLITEAEWEYVMYERGLSRDKLIEIYKIAFERKQVIPLLNTQAGQLTSFNIMAYPNFGLTEMTWDEYGSFSSESQRDPTGATGLYSRGVRKVRRYFSDSILFHRLSMRISGGEGEFIGIRLAQDRL